MPNSPRNRMRFLAETALAPPHARLAGPSGNPSMQPYPRLPLAPMAEYSRQRETQLRDDTFRQFDCPELVLPQRSHVPQSSGIFAGLSFFIVRHPTEASGDRETVVKVGKLLDLLSHQIGGGTITHISTAGIVIFPTQPGEVLQVYELQHIADLVSHSCRPCISYLWLFHSLACGSALPFVDYAVPISFAQNAVDLQVDQQLPPMLHPPPPPIAGYRLPTPRESTTSVYEAEPPGSPPRSPLFTPESSISQESQGLEPSGSGKENESPEMTVVGMEGVIENDPDRTIVVNSKTEVHDDSGSEALGSSTSSSVGINSPLHPDATPLSIPPSPNYSEWLPSDQASSSPDPGLPRRQGVSSAVSLQGVDESEVVRVDLRSQNSPDEVCLSSIPLGSAPPANETAKATPDSTSQPSEELSATIIKGESGSLASAKAQPADLAQTDRYTTTEGDKATTTYWRNDATATVQVPALNVDKNGPRATLQRTRPASPQPENDQPPTDSHHVVSDSMFAEIFGTSPRLKVKVKLPQATPPTSNTSVPLREIPNNTKISIKWPEPSPPSRLPIFNPLQPVVSSASQGTVAGSHERRQSLPAGGIASRASQPSHSAYHFQAPTGARMRSTGSTSSRGSEGSRLGFPPHWTSGTSAPSVDIAPSRAQVSGWRKADRNTSSQPGLPRPNSTHPPTHPPTRKRNSTTHETFQRKRARPSNV